MPDDSLPRSSTKGLMGYAGIHAHELRAQVWFG